jgi:hypothetical protein
MVDATQYDRPDPYHTSSVADIDASAQSLVLLQRCCSATGTRLCTHSRSVQNAGRFRSEISVDLL